MSQGMRMDFFLESPFMPNRMKLDRETLGGLADMFGQMPGMGFVQWGLVEPHHVVKYSALMLYSLFIVIVFVVEISLSLFF